jgi:glyoxylase-like metal-dependent hydrolase (beta-lactamase superfamily II)
MPASPMVHQHTSSAEGALVNAYLVEAENGVVAVDSMLTVTDSRMLRHRLEELGKPLLAVLLTHSHPDHYGGLTELVAGDDVPIVAHRGVREVIGRDDPVKEEILRPMFGDEWPRRRTFPNTVVDERETVVFDGLSFTVIDLGPSESPPTTVPGSWARTSEPSSSATRSMTTCTASWATGSFASGLPISTS